ncbi:unnamed protein product [Brassica rapa]|uniref:Uncharacterized protein n=1 Tax=Brassica campestris TaxID=3711 RepID=A0A3P6CYH4_BRACM|nr:unnamed protein product [Brassica rapa]VDD15431.1 unnamed protein product [Brassica rapa]
MSPTIRFIAFILKSDLKTLPQLYYFKMNFDFYNQLNIL